MNKPENRIDQLISELLRGRRLKLRGGDGEEKDAIMLAARLAGSRLGPQRMTPAFRQRLARVLEQKPEEAWVTRRAALVAGLGLAAGAATGGLLGRGLAPATLATAKSTGGEVIDPRPGRWVDVAALSDLEEGQGKRVTAGGVGAFVFRSGNSVTAVSSICSHLPCELWWDNDNAVLACPCHPAAFMADGRSTDTTYRLPSLNTVHVRVTPQGRVEVLGT